MILTRKIWKYNSEGELRYQRHIDRNEGLILPKNHVGNDEPGVAPPDQEEPIQSDAEVTIIHVWDILYVYSWKYVSLYQRQGMRGCNLGTNLVLGPPEQGRHDQ